MSAEHLCDALHAIDHDRLGQCYLLMQRPEATADEDACLQELLSLAGVESIPLRIPLLPEAMRPYLVPVALQQGMPATVSAVAVDMALHDKSAQALAAGRTQRCCAWIWTSLDADALRRNLERHAIASCPASHSHRRWLRYYDPMVLDVLWALLADESRASLLSGVEQWAYVDRWGVLSVIEPPSAEPSPSPTIDWPRVAMIGALNQAWIHASSRGTTLQKQCFLELQQSMWTAAEASMQDTADRDLFALHALDLGPGFHRHPIVQSALAAVADGARYSDIVRGWDAAAWQHLREAARKAAKPSVQGERGV